MNLTIDSDVKAVAEFMQTSLPAGRLVAVAKGLSDLAPLLWGKHPVEALTVLRLVPPPISSYDQRTQSGASELCPQPSSAGGEPY